MDEVWRPVVGFEESHEVSNLGRVRSIARAITRRANRWSGLVTHIHAQRILGLRPERGGYLRSTISLDGRQKQCMVHRLVANAFLDPAPTEEHQINHRDGNKANNRADNLEWVTRAENMNHAYANGLKVPVKGSRHGRSKLTEEQVAEIKALGGTLSQHQIAKRFGVGQPQIHRILSGRRWAHLD
ncbi:MAG: Deep-sea thermophilic phage [Pseudomonadota bacterium]|jgi:hypothetical protein